VTDAVLDVSGLTVAYRDRAGAETVVVHDVALALRPGQIHGLAGESGCGKSTAALAAIGFDVPGSVLLGGRSMLDGEDLLTLPRRRLRHYWGSRIAYVGQDASQALDPLRRVEQALAQPLRLHLDLRRGAVRERSLELLESVGIPEPERALRRYPHEFSGGQQQRIALAIALACRPAVLVLDEPTTGLDVTTQAQISALVRGLVDETDAATVMISHDLALLGTVADTIAIMYAGEIVEEGPARQVHSAPRHPYAAALLDAAPDIRESAVTVGIPGVPPPSVVLDRCPFAERCRFAEDRCRAEHPVLAPAGGGDRRVRCVRADELGVIQSDRRALDRALQPEAAAPLLVVQDVVCSYGTVTETTVVHGVSIEVAAGETLGVVGESGSGKSTLLRAIAGLHPPDAGTISFAGAELAPRAAARPRAARRAMQLVFQNPDSSLNPRHAVWRALDRPLRLFRPELDAKSRAAETRALLAAVRLDDRVLERYPSELSGGQKQRVALARAFAAHPELILCDEVVSALDVSVQASVLELLAQLSRERGTALVFVTHDLAVVRSIADRICVLRDGRVRETGPTEQLFTSPQDAYTIELLDAVPAVAARAPAPAG
jgi:peptide/nickel transport system ATP-binding protein